MKITNLTPMWPVHDIPAACEFLTKCLGFEVVLLMDTHAYCQSGGGAIRLIRAAPHADLDDEARQMHFYLDCDDVDARYLAHKEALDALEPTHFKPPFDTPWGQREFHVIHAQAQFSIGKPLE